MWCGSRCSRGGVFFFFFAFLFSFSFRCVRGGVGLGVFRYVGEGNVCPCQCVLCFSGWVVVWGLRINLWGLFLGWVWCCFGVCGGVGCVWLFFGVRGGVVLGVFRYVGEPIICPCQCVMHFGADFHFWGLKINLWVLFIGLVGCGCLLGDLRALILGWLLLGVLVVMSVFFLLLIG